MAFDTPESRSYLETHEWILLNDDVGTVGITDFAQDELGDVIFVEFPEIGRELDSGEQFGSIESIKAVSELYAPLAGRVIEVNERVADSPELVNQDPYGDGWLIKIEPTDGDTGDLLTAEEYRTQTA